MIETFVSQVRSLGPPFVSYGGNYLLPVAATGLAVLGARLWSDRAVGVATRRLVVARRAWWLAACLVAATSVTSYFNFLHHPYGRYLNPYEFFHYYLGSKYASELGYDGLYEAAVVADTEAGGHYRPADGAVRDLATNTLVPVHAVIAEHVRVRSRFSFEGWRTFVSDIVYFRDRMGPDGWNRVLHDRGYNATPSWTMVAGSLSRLVPTTSERGMLALSLLDVALLVVTATVVARTYGGRSAILLVALLGSFYLMAHAHMKGAFLRTDFAVALTLAVCALKSGRAFVAGLLAAYATMSRVFPAAFLFGLVALAAWDLRPLAGCLTRPAVTRWVRFFGAYCAGLAALFLLSAASAGSLRVWADFFDKIFLHRDLPHIWNVGFDALVRADFGGRTNLGLPPDTPVSSPATPAMLPFPGPFRTTLGWLVRIAALGASVLAVRRLAPHRALAFGFVPFFFLVAPTYYYYIVILLPFLFFAERPERPPNAAGIAYLYLFGAAGFAFYSRWDQYFATTFWSSAIGLGLVGFMTWVAMRDGRGVSRHRATP